MLLRSQDEITAKWPSNATPLVCIRCTTFNQEKFIAQCLDGFLIQETNFPFEVIVHDDASSDKTADIIREYAAKYPKIIKPYIETENQWSKNDGSFTRIMNSLLTRKYVAMCEGDDYWIDPQKLQLQIDFLENHPDYMMVFHDAEIKNEPGVKPIDSVYPKMEDRDYTATEIYEEWTIPTASMVYRLSAMDYPIKNPLNILNGDIFLAERCAHMGKIRCINRKMSVYRRQPCGVTWDKSKKIARALELINHLKEIKADFPLIRHNKLNIDICRSIIHVVHIEGSLKHIPDLIYAFFLSPSTFVNALKKKKFLG